MDIPREVLPVTIGGELVIDTIENRKHYVRQWTCSNISPVKNFFRCDRCQFEIKYEIRNDPMGPQDEKEELLIEYCPRCGAKVIPYIGK